MTLTLHIVCLVFAGWFLILNSAIDVSICLVPFGRGFCCVEIGHFI